MRQLGLLVAATMALACGSGAQAAEVTVVVAGVRDLGGEILIAACDEAHFLEPSCSHSGSAPAVAGVVEIVLSDLAPGTYAFQAFHDVNRNGEIDTSFFGRPLEGMGFSNDAKMRFGPPDYRDAAVDIESEASTIRFTMRYFD